MWLPGSRRFEVVLSPKSQNHASPAPPPEASVKFTVNGAKPLWGLALIAGLGGRQLGPLPELVPEIADFTGKTADADTATVPPTMLEMIGVMTRNRQVRRTVARSPIPVATPSPSASAKVGDGGVAGLRVQFVAAASEAIWCWYWVIASVSLVS